MFAAIREIDLLLEALRTEVRALDWKTGASRRAEIQAAIQALQERKGLLTKQAREERAAAFVQGLRLTAWVEREAERQIFVREMEALGMAHLLTAQDKEADPRPL